MFDMVAGLLAALVGGSLVKTKSRLHRTIAIGMIVFGGLVAVASLSPLDCDPTTINCHPFLRHPTLVIHGLASIVSVLALFVAVVTAGFLAWTTRIAWLRWLAAGMMAIWVTYGLVTVFNFFDQKVTNTNQYYLITICGLSLPLLILIWERAP